MSGISNSTLRALKEQQRGPVKAPEAMFRIAGLLFAAYLVSLGWLFWPTVIALVVVVGGS